MDQLTPIELAEKYVVHCKKKVYDIYGGRPGAFGNPFTHLQVNATQAKYQTLSIEESIEKHKAWFLANPALVAEVKKFKDKVWGCWCRPTHPCHCDIYAVVANSNDY